MFTISAAMLRVRPVRSGCLIASLFATPGFTSGVPAVRPQSSSVVAAADELANARAFLDGNRLAEAENATRSYIAAHGKSAEAHALLAYILFREQKPVDSLAEYTAAARYQTPTAWQLKYVAYDYVLVNDYADADKWMSKAAQWAPQDSDIWYSLGRIKYTLNRFAEAIECFKKTLALSPRMVKAEDNLGLAYEGLNRMEDAIAAYRTAIDWQAGVAHPSEQPLLNLGTLLADRNQGENALPLLKQAEAIAPNDPKIRVVLGRLYQRQGQLAEAQSELERAVALAPKTAAYHFQLGQVYRRTGLTDKAKAEFAQAAALAGSHSSE